MKNIKRTLLLIAISVLGIHMTSHAQSNTMSTKLENKTLSALIKEIEEKTNYTFFINEGEVNVNDPISNVTMNKAKVEDVLSAALSGTHYFYELKNRQILIKKGNLIKITGTVVDLQGEPVIGASVKIKEENGNGAITDIYGDFSLQTFGHNTLLVSYLGYNTIAIKINAKSKFDITLEENSKALDEVIVTALGIKREEKALGYSVQSVSGKDLTNVKGVDMATSLTGKVAGLNVKNSSEFNTAPAIELRGRSPLIVIDGVANKFISLRDIPADDIESITVLKGATASALYGSEGGAGALMITTKKAAKKGFDISVNSSTMFNAGYVARPKTQTSYSTGQSGKYMPGSYVWGDKLDIGRYAEIYNPYTQQRETTELVSKGKNNLKNFQETSLVTNNNVSIAQRGENGGVRASFTHVYNKGQYPNAKLQKFTYSVSGDMKFDKFTFEGGLTYNKRFYPNMGGSGYGGGGLLYNLTVWSGAEYDIRDYKDYWIIPNEKQNWMDGSWYDNPYFIANEIVHSNDYDVVNGYLNAEYETTDWLKMVARIGVDHYSQLDQWRNPMGAVGGWNKKGYYSTTRAGGYSVNGDAMAMADKKVGNFRVEGLIGAALTYRNNDSQNGTTNGGLSVPGFYSLVASVDPATTSSALSRKQVNSIYGRAAASWKSIAFIDITGRNDWNSTLDEENRSFFYPSFSGSLVMSEFTPLPSFIEFWKFRGSWTQTKYAPDIYAINQLYALSSDVWQGLGTASYPRTIRNSSIKPVTDDTWEIGTELYFLNGKIKFDFAYYNALRYNQQRNAGISGASGFNNTQINIQEELRRQGFEISVNATPIETKDLTWNIMANWSRDRYTYAKIDADYSTDKPWIYEGARWNWMEVYDWERNPQGEIIHYGGLPKASDYPTLAGYTEPDYVWGLSNTVRYKDFTLNFSFDGSIGGVAHSITDQAMWNSGSHPDSDNQYRYDQVVNGLNNYVGQGVQIVSGSATYDAYGNITHDDRIFTPNDAEVSYEVYQTRLAPYIGSVRSQFVFSRSFIKLRDLSIAYSLPKEFCQKFKAKGAAVSLVGQNLWMWAKDFKYSDPDVGKDNLNSASIRYVGFNLKLDF